MSNPFYSPEEVSDDDFLRNSRRPRPSAGGGGSGGSGGGSGGSEDYEHKRQLMAQKRREIEDRTLDSSQRSLGLLFESEKVGLATAEELNRQKEQLKTTEQRLDDINDTLKTSERHLQGVKSVFGGIMNYFAGRRAASSGLQPIHSSSESSIHETLKAAQQQQQRANPNHPGLRVRGMTEDQQQRFQGSDVDDILDRNLDEMSMGLSRLKNLAEGLNSELDEHDEIIGRIDDKVDKNAWRVNKQNKDMAKILKK